MKKKAASPAKPPNPKGPTMQSNYQGDLSGLSDNAAERSAELVSLFKQGRADMPFTILETAKGPLRAKLAVSSKAATIDGVRVNLSERGLQQVADALGMHLLTPYLVDEIQRRADLKLEPRPQAWYADGSMGNLKRMFDYNEIVNQELAGRSGTLISNEGKDWVLEGFAFNDKGLNRGTNYGWFKQDGTPIQGIGRVHNLDHSDYSQLVRLVSSVASVSDDGGQTYRNVSFRELVTSPKYFPLVSYERLPDSRHPGVSGMAV